MFTTKGNFIKVTDIKKGVSAKGFQWEKKSFLVSCGDNPYKKSLFSTFFDFDAAEFDLLEITFEILATQRQNVPNEEWYQNVNVTQIKNITQGKTFMKPIDFQTQQNTAQPAAQPQPQVQVQPQPQPQPQYQPQPQQVQQPQQQQSFQQTTTVNDLPW